MREPAAKISERQRVRDAIDEARWYLFSMIRGLHAHSRPATFKYTVSLLIRILEDPDADKLIRKYHPAPDTRDSLISFLRQVRLPPGRTRGPDNMLRDQRIANIVEIICEHRFKPTRNDVTKGSSRESACSIVAKAWRELEEGKPQGQFERGFAPLQAGATEALSEDRIETIWNQSEQAAQYRRRKVSGGRGTD